MGYQEVLKQAGGGALAGGGIGGPWGAAIGGGIGLLSGLFGGGGESENDKRQRQMLMDYYKNVQGRQPIELGATQYGSNSQVRSQQQTLADQLAAISSGKGPSLATEQLKQATDKNVAQQASFANSGRGGVMAAGMAANNSARLGAQAGQDAAVARMGEANQARSLLGLNLHGMREQDEGMSRFNAEQGNQMSQASLLARMKQLGMSDEAGMAAIQQLGGLNKDQANQPSFGDQLLAGGAGLYSMGTTQRAQSRAASAAGSLPTGGGINAYWRSKLMG